MKLRKLFKISPLAAESEKALKEAVRDAYIDHKRTGDPVAIWKNGKVVWIPANKIPARLPSKKRASKN